MRRRGHSKKLRSFLAENVMGLCCLPKNADGTSVDPDTGKTYYSNLDFCVQQLEAETDVWVFVARLDPKMFGVPISRQRVWILAIPAECFEGAELSFKEATMVAQDILERLMVGQTRSIEDYLLPEHHPAIINMLHEARRLEVPKALKRQKVRDSSSAGAKALSWPEQNTILFESKGLDWWVSSVPPADTMEAWPGLKVLTYRQFDIIRLSGIDSFPDPEARQVDVSQGGTRARATSKQASCIVTFGGPIIYLGSRCRLIHAFKEMHTQGIHFGKKELELREVGSSLVRSLAGNAWETTCAAAMVIVQETFFGHPCNARQVPRVAAITEAVERRVIF